MYLLPYLLLLAITTPPQQLVLRNGIESYIFTLCTETTAKGLKKKNSHHAVCCPLAATSHTDKSNSVAVYFNSPHHSFSIIASWITFITLNRLRCAVVWGLTGTQVELLLPHWLRVNYPWTTKKIDFKCALSPSLCAKSKCRPTVLSDDHQIRVRGKVKENHLEWSWCVSNSIT